ncbi:D-alanine--D-alanine ligase [bacterium]|nr:D-alanine--D-alanine ligase [bacterium]
MKPNRNKVGTMPAGLMTTAEIVRKIGRKKIVVIMGGFSAEREISLLTGQAMFRALRTLRCNVSLKDIKSPKDLSAVTAMQPAVVVNGLHGPGGEDGSVQAALAWQGIVCTGSGTLASALAMDKHRAKMMFRANGLPTADWTLIDKQTGRMQKQLRLPVVVKPNRLGSAIGISVVKQPRQWKAALEQARGFGDDVLVEKYCAGREISVGVVKGRPLPIIEIVSKKEFYDYEAKYVAGMSEHIIPARISSFQSARAKTMAKLAIAVLGCQGTPRVDMIVMKNGRMVILEVNTLPGMTATSLLPEAARSAGIEFEQLVGLLVLDAWDALR